MYNIYYCVKFVKKRCGCFLVIAGTHPEAMHNYIRTSSFLQDTRLFVRWEYLIRNYGQIGQFNNFIFYKFILHLTNCSPELFYYV